MNLFDLWKISVIGITLLGGILGYIYVKDTYFPVSFKLLVVIWLSLAFFYFYMQSWMLIIWISEIIKRGEANMRVEGNQK